MNKIPLVLLTGLLSNERLYQYQAQKLKELADITIINFPDLDSGAAMVQKVLDQAPERFALAGHSMGGWVAQALMKKAAQRVTKLCLLNTSSKSIDAPERNARQLILERIEKGEFKQVAKEIANRFTFKENKRQEVLSMFLEVGETTFIKQTKAMMTRESVEEALPKIHCPTLIIYANQDQRFSLQDHQHMHNIIPHSKLEIINDCGHMSPMECPEAVTNLMRSWLI